jgi:hypothetical protein
MNGRDLSEVRAMIRRFAQGVVNIADVVGLTAALANKQDADADLTAIAALGSTGIAVRTAADTWAQRTITSADATVTITNPGGVAGNIDLSVSGGGTTFLGTITTTSGSSQSLSSLTLTTYKFLRLTFVGVSTNNASWLLQVDGLDITGTPQAAASVLRGSMDIDLANGVFTSQITNVGANNSAASSNFAGDTSITTASTSVTVSTSAGTFDAGNIRVYGIA